MFQVAVIGELAFRNGNKWSVIICIPGLIKSYKTRNALSLVDSPLPHTPLLSLPLPLALSICTHPPATILTPVLQLHPVVPGSYTPIPQSSPGTHSANLDQLVTVGILKFVLVPSGDAEIYTGACW